jgi:hypothetical protein
MTFTVDGKLTCDSNTLYGTKPEYIAPAPAAGSMGGHSHGGANMKHISEQPACHGDSLAVKKIRKGQVWALKAYYDFDLNKGIQHENGEFFCQLAVSTIGC